MVLLLLLPFRIQLIHNLSPFYMAFSNRKMLPETQSPEPSPFCFSLCLSDCLDPGPVVPVDGHHHPYLIAFKEIMIVLIALSSLLLLFNGIYTYILSSRRRRRRNGMGPIMDMSQGHAHHAHVPTSRDHDHDHLDHDFLLDERGTPIMVEHHIWYINTVGLQSSVINSIAVCKYKKSDGMVEGTDCAVCLSEFEEDESLRILPKCNHAFHLPCIDTWLTSHTNCPMCRAPILSNSAPNPSSGSPQLASSSGNYSDSGANPRDHDVEDEISGPLGVLRSNMEEGSEESVYRKPLRRTFSMDFVSGSSPIFSTSYIQPVEIGREADNFCGCGAEEGASSSSSSRLPQRGLGSKNRSMSCNGNFLPSRSI